MSELLPCPFCGAKAKMSGGNGEWYVECSECLCAVGETSDRDGDSFGLFDTKEEATIDWNKRTS